MQAELDPLARAKACEQNLQAYAVALAEAGNGYVLQQGDALLTAFPYNHYINGVHSPRFTEQNALERVREIITVFRMWGRGVRFWLGPSTEPADLAQWFEGQGASRRDVPYMACALPLSAREVPLPNGLPIRIVEDYGEFGERPHPLHGCLTSPRKRRLFAAFGVLAHEDPRSHWMFIAEKEGRAVGAAVLYLYRHVAGLYDLAVCPEFRGQGIGAALVQRASAFACERDARLGVAAAGARAAGFFNSIGFQPAGCYVTFAYSRQRLQAGPTPIERLRV